MRKDYMENHSEFNNFLQRVEEENLNFTSLPIEAMHCLTEKEARLAYLLKSHVNELGLIADTFFVANAASKHVNTSFGNNLFSGTEVDSSINYNFEGRWFLRAGKQKFDVCLGSGKLKLCGVDAANSYAFNHLLGNNQIGHIEFPRSLSAPQVEIEELSGVFYLERIKLAEFLLATNSFDGFVASTKLTKPCAPGYNNENKNIKIFGPVFSVAISSVNLTTSFPITIGEQGGNYFYLKIVKEPEKKLELTKYISSLNALSVKEIATNLTEISNTGWIFFSTNDLVELVKVYKQASMLGAEIEIENIWR